MCAFAAVSSPTSYTWFDARSPKPSREVSKLLTEPEKRHFLRLSLQQRLYSDFYTQGIAVRQQPVSALALSRVSDAFAESLSAANTGEGVVEDGWQIEERRGESLNAVKGGMRISLRDHDIVAPSMPGADGLEVVRVRLPKELRRASPGYYVALGNVPLGSGDWVRILRLYWAVTPDGAVPLVRQLTSALNTAGVAFRLKVLSDPDRYSRYDTGVLYVRRADRRQVLQLVGPVYAGMASEMQLRAGVPALVKPIAPGLGIADDPGQGESFGLQRCQLLADGLIRCFETGTISFKEKLSIVDTELRGAGIDPDKPYLQPGTDDVDAGDVFVISTPAQRPPEGVEGGQRTTDWLSVPVEIGSRLFAEAIWSGKRCNWLGATPLDPKSSGFGRTHSALGGDLYSGTSGLAWFLAELDHVVDDPLLRRTALGALRHALAHSRAHLIPQGRIGLYTGAMGVALVAAHLAVLWESDELWSDSTDLARCALASRAERSADLLAGAAGVIIALLALDNAHPDETFVSHAIRLADELIEEALVTDDCSSLSWRSASPRQRPLTGLSHGTAGIGQALMAVFAATGDQKYANAAEAGFAYERRWFNSGEQNWLDLRLPVRSAGRSGMRGTFGVSWCHGAPGIALSRLCAYEASRSAVHRAEAESGLQATRRIVESWLDAENANYSLCHGLSGNVEVLLYGAETLGGQWAENWELAARVADIGLESYTGKLRRWPCGTPHGGELPSLMLGLAGIGYFYLRLVSPSKPSLLLIRTGTV